MTLLPWQAKAIGGVIVLVVLAGLGTALHHAGYVAGQAERAGFYEPLMRAAERAKAVADARTAAIERTAAEVTQQSEKDHALMAQTLADRAAAADASIARLLRERARRAACGGEVPPVPGPPGVVDRGAASDERDSRLAASVSGVGGRCEHDAAAVAGFLEWYRKERLIFDQD